MKTKDRVAGITYVLTHAFFWCSYCVTWSYIALYMGSKGCTSTVIGMVTGIGAILSVILQPVLSTMGFKNYINVVAMKIIGTVLSVIVLMFDAKSLILPVVFVVLTCIDASIPSILSSLAMEYVNEGGKLNYGFARGIGSISYATFSLLTGLIIRNVDVDMLMIAYIVLNLITIICIMVFPKSEKKTAEDEKTSLLSVLSKYNFLVLFLIGSVLLYVKHNMVNVFLLNIVNAAGGDSGNLGICLYIGAACELPAMLGFAWLLRKIDVKKLLRISAIGFVIKAIAMCFAYNMPMMYIACALQFCAFAIYTPASVYFINKYLKGADSKVGQALVGACTLGLGGLFGNIIGGYIIDTFSLSAMLITAAVISAVGAFCLIGSMRRVEEK